jgi:hypothetical protein
VIHPLSLDEARGWFSGLPPARRIATLSPDYVVADATRDVGLEALLLGYREGEFCWYHGVHRGRVPRTASWDFQSPYGYGGPVSNTDDPEFLVRAWVHYSAWCRENGILAEFVRLHPMAAGSQCYGGEIRNDRQTVVVVLEENARDKYEVRCRTAVRKAEKSGVSFHEAPPSEITGFFPAFYRQGMTDIGAAPFYHFNDAYFAALARIPGCHLMTCQMDSQIVSAGLFFSGDRLLEYHLSATTSAGRKVSATNLLIDGAIRWGVAHGLHDLYLGGGSDGREGNPLFFFKAGFSSQRKLFQIGYTIHQPEAYAHLRESYCATGGASQRVLFYR